MKCSKDARIVKLVIILATVGCGCMSCGKQSNQLAAQAHQPNESEMNEGLPGITPVRADQPTNSFSTNPAENSDGKSKFWKGVRISRAFFEKPVVSDMVVSVAESEPATGISNTSWQVDAQKADRSVMPSGALAEFHDQKGCLSLEASPGSAVCFHLEGDVSTVQVNEDKAWLVGAGKLVTAVLGQSRNCRDTAAYVDSAKNKGSLKVLFKTECDEGPVQFQLTFKQAS